MTRAVRRRHAVPHLGLSPLTATALPSYGLVPTCLTSKKGLKVRNTQPVLVAGRRINDSKLTATYKTLCRMRGNPGDGRDCPSFRRDGDETMTSRRRMMIAAVAAAGFLLTGCSGPGVPVLASGNASTVGVVAAIRLSPQLYDIDRGARVGWVLLIDGRGRAVKLKTGPMDTGHLTWTRTGLSFSDQHDEYVLSDEGLSTVVRGSEEVYETSRFPTTDGAGFIAVYNVGFGDRTYEARVTTGNATANRSWDVAGMYEAVSQCGGSVFAMTDIKELGPGFATKVRTDALVQLYPEPKEKEAAVRATLPIPQ